MKKNTFAKGAFILAAATALGKAFSAVFKIPLDKFFLHEEGMALFNGVYNTYMFFFAVAQSGVPPAISGLIASSKTKEEEDKILSTALLFMLILFGASGLLLFLFSDAFASLVSLPESAPGFRIIAPALLFCAVTAVFKGFFQGKMAMLPSAVAQVCDSFCRLTVGFSAACLLMGESLPRVASGALSGVPAGAFLCASVLLFSFFKLKRPIRFSFSQSTLLSILRLALPITVTASLYAVFNMIDTVGTVSLLTYFKMPDPTASFGILGRAAMLYVLPVSIVTSLSSSIIPAISESVKDERRARLSEDASLCVRLTLFVSVPCVAGFAAVPDGIFDLLFSSSAHPEVLTLIAPSVLFSGVASSLAGILQALGKTKKTLVAAVLAILSKLVLNPVFIKLFGIAGAAVSTSASYLLFMLILIFTVAKLKIFPFSLKTFVIKPLFCALACFIAAKTAFVHTNIFFAIALAAAVYIPCAVCLKVVSKDEIKQIFVG